MRETNMKKFITKQILGVTAQLCASAAMAGTVEVRPISDGTPLDESGAPCLVVSSRCEMAIIGNTVTFQVVVVGDSQPANTTGLTLGMRFSLASGTGSIDWVAADNSSLPPTAGGAFTGVVATPDPGTFASPIGPIASASCANFADCIISNLAPTAGTLPQGTIYGMVLGFSATCTSVTCTWLVDIDDDGGDFAWTSNAGSTVNTYTQARILQTVPVPAAAWLLLSGLGSLVGLKRFRRQ
jgi:hypothetical protein